MRQIEPPPVSEIDSDPSVVQPVDWHTARKVEFGPLQERDGSAGETWELNWDEEGKKEWPALLRVLQQLTGQVVWPARQARGMSLPGDSQDGSTEDADVDMAVALRLLDHAEGLAPRHDCSLMDRVRTRRM